MQKAAGRTSGFIPTTLAFRSKTSSPNSGIFRREHFILGNGSDEIIHFLALALLDAQTATKSFSPIHRFVQYKAAAMHGRLRVIIAVPLTPDMRHDLRAMKRAGQREHQDDFHRQPEQPDRHHGCRARELEELLDGLPPRVVVVLDQAYYEYVEDDDSPERPGLHSHGHNVVVLQTFSKAYALAGLRVRLWHRAAGNDRAICSRCAGRSMSILWRRPRRLPAWPMTSR